MTERTKWDVIAERKRLKRERNSLQGASAGLLYSICGLCDRQYCTNNYEDRKVRLQRWHGVEICAHCKCYVLPGIRKVMALKIVKFTKAHRPEKK